jgi:hypothetical protein
MAPIWLHPHGPTVGYYLGGPGFTTGGAGKFATASAPRLSAPNGVTKVVGCSGTGGTLLGGFGEGATGLGADLLAGIDISLMNLRVRLCHRLDMTRPPLMGYPAV